MSESCLPIEALDRVLSLPSGHPERAHLESCTRCRSLADMLRDFESPAAAPPEAGLDFASPRLRETISELTGIAMGESPAPDVAHPAPRETSRPRTAWWSALLAPQRLRLAGALAALLVMGAVGVTLWRGNGAPPVMRDAGTPAAQAFAAAPARMTPDGVVLEWTAAAGANAYRVVFLDSTLREIAHLGPIAVTSARLDTAALPAGLARGMDVAWQVEALLGNDRLAATAPQPLHVH